MDLKDVGLLVAVASSLAGTVSGYARMVQKVKDNQEANNQRFEVQDKKFEGHSRMHEDHFRLSREHEAKDREHLLDTNVHWTQNERQLMWRRFDDLKDRVDDLKESNERQESLLKEILLIRKGSN